jgi:hypothetical protein
MPVIPVIVGLGSAAVFCLLLLKLLRRTQSGMRTQQGQETIDEYSAAAEWSQEWFEEFSSFRYLPMRRLLSAEEEAYWVQTAGDGPQSRQAFRAERREVYRAYLRLMKADFRCLSTGLRLSIVHAPEDQSAEISRMIRLEWSLRSLLLQAELRLMFHWLGVRPIDATRLINVLQGFEFSLREIRLNSASA